MYRISVYKQVFHFPQILINSFLLELFTSIVIDTYDRLRDEAAGSVLLTPSQQIWVSVSRVSFHSIWHDTISSPFHLVQVTNMRTLLTLEPATLVEAPETEYRLLRSLQRTCFRLVTWRGFDPMVVCVIVANVAFACLRHAGQETGYTNTIAAANVFFTVLFGLEALVKVRILTSFWILKGALVCTSQKYTFCRADYWPWTTSIL